MIIEQQTAVLRRIIMKSFIRQELSGQKIISDQDMRLVGYDPDDVRSKINIKIETPNAIAKLDGYEHLPYFVLERVFQRTHIFHIDFANWRLTLPNVPDTRFTRWIVSDKTYYWLACYRACWWRPVTPNELEQLKTMIKE